MVRVQFVCLQSGYQISATGPISLILLEFTPLRNPDSQMTLWNTHPSLESLSVHFVSSTQQQLESFSPNVYLNLARLLASTSYTMLFPGNMSLVASDLTMTKMPTSGIRSAITVVTSGNRVTYPPPSLSPILVQRDHPCWCTERFTFSNSRILNWDQCLTQFWLDSYGHVDGLNATIADGIKENGFSDAFAVCTLVCSDSRSSSALLRPKHISNSVQNSRQRCAI
ncbi:hypothetical protein F5890DRAFT_424135 [Lentinula detonsa]|uniref:Uncharacterized protein n=1 Tax=Lentinula detonsa TaxID=2804962 RepID=A0AA38Q7G3_9AGAR|nr:hypothetical protein F5890DRAFT_424135 [Lentinula detonsa]